MLYFKYREVPVEKRIYFLKRTDGRPYMGIEAEEGSAIRPEKATSDPSCSSSWRPTEECPLDLSKERSSPLASPSRSDPGISSILDLSMPDRNATTEVCYICGKELKKGSLRNIFSKPVGNFPYFPNLSELARRSKSRPMDSAGRILGCEECYRQLVYQWQVYQKNQVPNDQRTYNLGRSAPSSRITPTQFICFTCGLEYPGTSARTLHTRPNAEGEPYFPSIEIQKPPPGSAEASPQGTIQVCHICNKGIRQKERFAISSSSSTSCRSTSPLKRPSSQDLPEVSAKKSAELHDEFESGLSKCCLCNAVYKRDVMKMIDMVKDQDLLSRIPDLSRMIGEGSKTMLVCNRCHTLVSAWTDSERTKVSGSSDQTVKEEENKSQGDVSSCKPSSPSTREEVKEIKEDLRYGPVCLLQSHNPKSLICPVLCRCCGIDVENSSLLSVDVYSDGTGPAFPFLQEKFGQHGKDARVCKYCHYNLLRQWHNYEKEQKPAEERTYNVHDFVCYVCGVATYRKRVRCLSVVMFPFLRNHKKAENSFTLGEDEVCSCLDCYKALTTQYKEYEQWGLPMEKRNYNWVKAEPPPESKMEKKPQVDSGVSGSTKPPPLQLKPPQRTTATVPPLHPPPSALTTSMAGARLPIPLPELPPGNNTSSFAAALRNLAKQAGEPGSAESGGSECGSQGGSLKRTLEPPLVQQSSSGAPPVVTIAPTQSYLNQTPNTVSLASNCSSPFTSVPQLSGLPPTTHPAVSYPDSLTRSSVHHPGDDLRLGFTCDNILRNYPGAASGHVRGFQPYSTAAVTAAESSSVSSAAAAAAAFAGGYPSPYLPLGSHLPQHGLSRLEEQLYLERLGLLRGGSMLGGLGGPSSPMMPSLGSLGGASPYFSPEMMGLSPLSLMAAHNTHFLLQDRMRLAAEQQQKLKELEREREAREREREREKLREKERDRSPIRKTTRTPPPRPLSEAVVHPIPQGTARISPRTQPGVAAVPPNNTEPEKKRSNEVATSQPLNFHVPIPSSRKQPPPLSGARGTEAEPEIGSRRLETMPASSPHTTPQEYCLPSSQENGLKMSPSARHAAAREWSFVKKPIVSQSAVDLTTPKVPPLIIKKEDIKPEIIEEECEEVVEVAEAPVVEEKPPEAPPEPPRTPPPDPKKVEFLANLGLRPMNKEEKQERREIWQGVMLESLKRKGVLPGGWGSYASLQHAFNAKIQQSNSDSARCSGESDVESEQQQSSDHWPGIDAILEAYRHHVLEAELEKAVLNQRCRELSAERGELQNTLESLNQQMSSLVTAKEQADSHRAQLCAHSETLKTYLEAWSS